MKSSVLEAYCKDLLNQSIEIGNQELIKELNRTYLDIANNRTSNHLLSIRLKRYEDQLRTFKLQQLPKITNLSKRALIISNNENNSEYFAKRFKTFTLITLSQYEKEEKIEECLKFVANGKVGFIFSTIALKVPHLKCSFSMVVSEKTCEFDNMPTVLIQDDSMFGSISTSISRYLFISCSAILEDAIMIDVIKEILRCKILVHSEEFDKNILEIPNGTF